MSETRAGLILLFEGDRRKVNIAVKNVTSFTAISEALMNGATDVSTTYCNQSPAATSAGNILISSLIGDKASIPAGDYRLYLTGTYSGKIVTFYWDIIVLPKNGDLLDGMDWSMFSQQDYSPFIEEFVLYEGDKRSKILTSPGADFSTASGVLKRGSDDRTSTYCNGSVSVSGEDITTHLIGGLASIPQGEYYYFITGTYNNAEAISTWFYKVKALAKQSII